MPQLSEERILELQQIIKEDYGREFSFAEATEAASNLVGFFDLLAETNARNNRSKKVKNQKHVQGF